MSTLNNTDVFAVTRGTSTYKVSFADIAAGVPLPPALVYKGSWAPTATAPVPAGGLKAGMVYVMTPAGTLSASWVGIGGRHADDGQLAIWEGAKWELVGNTGAIPDATATVKGVVQLADAAAVTAGTPARVVDAAELKSGLASKADLASPALTGTPTAPTAAAGTNTTQLATTAFVHAAVAEEDFWDRTGTELSPKTAGDSVFTSGEVKVGGTTAAPNITLKADGTAYVSRLLRITSPNGTKAELEIGQTTQESWFWRSPAGNRDLALHQYNGGADTQRLRVMHDTGDFLLGGTLPGSPNITLKADGLIKAGAGTASIPYNIFKSGLQYALIIDQADATKNCLNLNSPAVPTGGQHKSIVISEAGVGKAEHRIHDTSYEIYSDKPAFDLTCVGGRARLTNTGDFLLGGTLPGSPNITLKADGAVLSAKQGNVNDLACKIDAGSWAQTNLIGHYYTGAVDATAIRVTSSVSSTSTALYLDNNGVFKLTGPGSADRFVVDSAGDFLLGGTLPASPNVKLGADGSIRSGLAAAIGYEKFTFAYAGGGANGIYLHSTSTAGDGSTMLNLSRAQASADPTKPLIICEVGGVKFEVKNSGNVVYAGTLTPPSDAALKEAIVDADLNSQWDDIKRVQLRKYQWKGEPERGTMLGVIAQELETVSPGLIVKDLDDDGNVVEGSCKVKVDALYMKMLGALQAAQQRIEDLETRLAALEPAKPHTP